jgi:hypothetical protein
LILVSGWYSYKELESRIGIKEILDGVLSKFRKK